MPKLGEEADLRPFKNITTDIWKLLQDKYRVCPTWHPGIQLMWCLGWYWLWWGWRLSDELHPGDEGGCGGALHLLAVLPHHHPGHRHPHRVI